MRIGIISIVILAVIALLLAGCSAPQCYPPNKIVDNKCCVDDDSNSVCDMDEPQPAEEEPQVEVQPEPVVEEEPQIHKLETPKTETVEIGLQIGKQMMKQYEKRDYIELNDFTMYRSSTDKAIMDFMVYTVRNPGEVTINPVVEILFEKARLDEHQSTVKKEYVLDPLKPGEKIVINQSIGVVFAKINETKEIHMRVYERLSAPVEEFGTVDKTFVPFKKLTSMEIFIHGLTEE
jgi:hypothetical protein